MTKKIKKEFAHLTPEELKEILKQLNKIYRMDGRSLSRIVGLSKSRIYQIVGK